jgi:streptomycin 6-kinase
MSFFIPPRVRETAAGFGAEGTRWLEHLPARIAELEHAWSLTAGQAFDTDGCVSWVAPVQLAGGSEAVLKISIPHPEARREADALRVYEGRGAVRLLRASEDGFSLLLERCVPGTNLWTPDVDEGNAAGAAVLRQLWREPPPSAAFDRLSALAAEWCASLPREAPAAGYDAALVVDAVRLARGLADTQPRQVLLHGDFHPGNVLAAAREPWLAIDCKPLEGDPAYDLAQWLGNRCEVTEHSPDAAAELQRQIHQFSDLLDLDPARIGGWAFVKSLGWDWGPRVARLLREALDD